MQTDWLQSWPSFPELMFAMIFLSLKMFWQLASEKEDGKWMNLFDADNIQRMATRIKDILDIFIIEDAEYWMAL